VAPALLGYAVLVLAALFSAVYLLQERQLKGRPRGSLFRRLPPLETLDQWNQRCVTWGFVLFTLGIVTGSVLAERTWGSIWSWEPVQVWSVVTWLVYGALAQARTVGWRGRRAARLTIASFLVLVASFVTVNLFFPGRHGV
jgi:ABC-type transport system involved in cytochrome c biogenesis permease subunit